MSDEAHFRLRIPRHLKEWVEKNAKSNNRSINAEILSCIEAAQKIDTSGVTDIHQYIQQEIKNNLDPLREEMQSILNSWKSEE
ncbi:Arc family DNA-binding protein [Acetobacter sp. TBRC 12305]|uniref:Arc family DNA-binding protein n=1 Tax=Acetobacter garciniae TaxID=2817435 RepID=A0A939KQH2_9PROT|nr:Arc family DNA-binding protein [Acetobacter garciniae]MBO1325332.1 Arc family DNA-binding protein [Acetobacter garciniae]MBX0345496.1 Arc family DNA-binding protein [Acetobacter garciniae]